MVYVSNLNRGCDIFKDSLNQLDAFSNADYWDVRDGVNNYLVHIDKNLWVGFLVMVAWLNGESMSTKK